MSRKRTAPEANDDEETTEAALQHEDKAKRAKLIPKYDKTLQDLPTRLLECILVEAVVKEVRSMRLAKSVWKEKTDLVISRLRTVCSQWNSILTTDRFLTEVHRILEGIDQETIRLEILHQSRIQRFSRDLTTLKEEMFILFYESYDESEHSVCVYDRKNLAEVKDVIALPGKYPLTLDACNVSNCVYVLCYHEDLNENSGSIFRIKKDEEHGFNILPWMSDLRKTPFISVLPNGILSVTHGRNPVALRNYDAKGSLVLSADIHGFRLVKRVMQKSNRNLIIAAMNDRLDTVLTEIDLDGKLKGQHISSHLRMSMHFADAYGRILVTDPTDGIQLLDSELNRLDLDSQQLGQRILKSTYNTERNVVVCSCVDYSNASFITTFRLTEV